MRQGNDVGSQYRSAIFYHTEEQQREALAALAEAQQQERGRIVTEVRVAGAFWPAEPHHQQYLERKGQSARKGVADPIRCYG
jgi:peptide-methionine (S)-S-oxide reductase